MATNDMLTVKGIFSRTGQKVQLWALPVTGVDECTQLDLKASGSLGMARLNGTFSTWIQTGAPEDPANQIPLESPSGITLYAPGDEDEILIQRGYFDDTDSSRITMNADHSIWVEAGDNNANNAKNALGGGILLACGDSYIAIGPSGITIKAPMVRINP
jgi:hypothetical protein